MKPQNSVMAVIAPPTVSKAGNKPVKQDKAFLKDALAAKMREVIVTEDGRQMTIAQAGAERLANIMLYAESNADSIQASKLIYERLYGKAAVEKVEETREMPKVIFSLSESGIEKMAEAVKESVPDEEQTDDALVHVKFDSGEEFLG